MPKLSVSQANWIIGKDVAIKDYKYCGLLGDDTDHFLQIKITFSRSRIMGWLEPHFHLLINPSLWPQMKSGYMVGQLAARDRSEDASFATVMIDHAEDGSLIVTTPSKKDTDAFVKTLKAGVDMQLTLINQNEVLMQLPIPNDPSAAEVLNKIA